MLYYSKSIHEQTARFCDENQFCSYVAPAAIALSSLVMFLGDSYVALVPSNGFISDRNSSNSLLWITHLNYLRNELNLMSLDSSHLVEEQEVMVGMVRPTSPGKY